MSPLAQTVRERLLQEPSWSFFAQNGKWICPYCLSAVAKRASRSREDSIALHLEGCRTYSAGRGTSQKQNVIAERMHFENMTFQAENNPSWRVYDHEGIWYCPSCLDRIMAVRLQSGQLNNFVFQAMASHLRMCTTYHQGVIYSADDVQKARDLSARTPGLTQLVSAQLQFAVWRYVDRSNVWVCPCCLAHVAEVVVRDAGDWQIAVDAITKHLLLRCTSFNAERFETQPEPLVQQAAAEPPGAKRPPSQQLKTVASAAPAAPTAPAAKPSIPQRHPTRTPPIARPASGASTTIANPSQSPAPSQRIVSPEPRVVHPGKPGTARTTASGAQIATPSPAGGSARDIKITDWDDEARDPTPSRSDVANARDLQAKMMAPSPELPGFKFATRYQACSDITGDFYEFIALADGRIGFALGDVSGHGMQAGLIMSMAKKTLEIYAGLGAGPVETLCKVNDALTRDLGGNMFISMIYGILDPDRRSIAWARAGGTPALRYTTSTGELTEIKPPGMVLGMKAGQTFRQSLKEESTDLLAGQTILLYTDGVTESMNAQQEEYGPERLGQLIKVKAAGGPEVLVEAIMEELERFRGELPVADDMTLLAMAVE